MFKSLLTSLLPDGVTVVDSADATAKALQLLLAQAALLTPNQPAEAKINYLVTDSIKRFQAVGEIFLAESLAIDNIELIDARSPS